MRSYIIFFYHTMQIPPWRKYSRWKSHLDLWYLSISTFFLIIKLVRKQNKFWPISLPWSLWFVTTPTFPTHLPCQFNFCISLSSMQFSQRFKLSPSIVVKNKFFKDPFKHFQLFYWNAISIFHNPINCTPFLWFGLFFSIYTLLVCGRT